MTYYIIENNYVGPNPQQNRDADHFLIQAAPGRTNGSREVRTEGYLGTTNDWAAYARGEFGTVKDAEVAIAELLPDGYRSMSPSDYQAADPEDGGVGAVAMFKPGKYEPSDRDQTQTFICDDVRDRITASTTDDEITEMVEDWQDAIREHWEMDLDEDAAREDAEARRDELKAEAAEEFDASEEGQ